MASFMQPLVDTFNSVGSTTGSFLSSLLTLNYYVGGSIFSMVKYTYVSFISLLVCFLTGVRVALEDLVIFLVELMDTCSSVLEVGSTVVDTLVDRFISAGGGAKTLVLGGVDSVMNTGRMFYNIGEYSIHSVAVFFNLLGSSLFLLVNLVPRTLYILFAALKSLVLNAATSSQIFATKSVEMMYTAPVELYVGLAVGTISATLLTKLILRRVEEHHITVESLATALLRLICRVYVLCIRTIARTVGLVFTVVELTVSNLRVPMFSHAGDSDDEDDDNENLVGEVNDSDDEDRVREEQKRKNYDLIAQRRNRIGGQGADETVEDLLLREVEREREDKLCVICVDKEKCIMILPCRHLCICESCQTSLRRHRNICPICRREVKQMIKAYL